MVLGESSHQLGSWECRQPIRLKPTTGLQGQSPAPSPNHLRQVAEPAPSEAGPLKVITALPSVQDRFFFPDMAYCDQQAKVEQGVLSQDTVQQQETPVKCLDFFCIGGCTCNWVWSFQMSLTLTGCSQPSNVCMILRQGL